MNQTENHRLPAFFYVSIFLVIFIFACDIGSTKIGEIIKHPREYAGKEVTVSGEVTETFSLIFVKYFVVRDDSGEIFVVTEKTLPAKGEKIKVTGNVQEAFSLGTETSLVLIEAPEKAKK
ncbi:MAG TPA: hypothetical protein PLV50_09890 [Smithella sp.]|nr:hypothetical protein [Smithella sp.]MDM7987373.1 hypothetical protein [Smithella sp.]HNY49726.1 hypothetical protein [Smithella sp.]HOG90840.1 hypothetical protein [Smithella sp.]HOU51201.1 hypothetical protein [Smithella sp.]